MISPELQEHRNLQEYKKSACELINGSDSFIVVALETNGEESKILTATGITCSIANLIKLINNSEQLYALLKKEVVKAALKP